MEQNILAQFGQCLRNARTKTGLSQEKLAEAANLDRTYISLLERGKRNPSLLCLASLCRALDINLSELFKPMQSDKSLDHNDIIGLDKTS
ncbi:helix-turn-helix domain-containing protein [Merismopedia glauca]|uniref:helix-turn-helix domain-containing protein n=1 Tax=Merismopedia glauca TaxID=292586 RepID=UPI001C6259BF|nr:helix-turn-helix transcriptional regulator [Merismopedia glauca]